jgi:hypothetical protein
MRIQVPARRLPRACAEVKHSRRVDIEAGAQHLVLEGRRTTATPSASGVGIGRANRAVGPLRATLCQPPPEGEARPRERDPPATSGARARLLRLIRPLHTEQKVGQQVRISPRILSLARVGQQPGTRSSVQGHLDRPSTGTTWLCSGGAASLLRRGRGHPRRRATRASHGEDSRHNWPRGQAHGFRGSSAEPRAAYAPRAYPDRTIMRGGAAAVHRPNGPRGNRCTFRWFSAYHCGQRQSPFGWQGPVRSARAGPCRS